MLTVLGIETSCDDTAAAIIRQEQDGKISILADIVHTQGPEHAAYGGIVPELAARSHLSITDRVVAQALQTAGMTGAGKMAGVQLDAVAATSGPGLIGGVLVGMMTAKALAIRWEKPFLPVNHLAGHALSVLLTEPVAYPFLLLLVSGGHTQLLEVRGTNNFTRLGTTIDDAAGEAFDKTAKLLGLGQPGGPNIEAAAQTGDPTAFVLPRPLHKRPGCDFSFSGLKTAIRQTAMNAAPLCPQTTANLAASFQASATAHLVARTSAAMDVCPAGRLVLAGGVAANGTIRSAFTQLCHKHGWEMFVPPPKLCTDNGAMIAHAALLQMSQHGIPDQSCALSLGPRPRWPLDSTSQATQYGGGKKGPKA